MASPPPSAAAAAAPAVPLRPVDLFFGQPTSTNASSSTTTNTNKPPVQHMSMLNGVPVAQPTSIVLEGQSAHDYRMNHVGGGGGQGGDIDASDAKQAFSTVTVGVAPSVAGISKIRPTAAAADGTHAAPTSTSTNNVNRPKRIRVPQRVIQGGLDAKFDPDPYGLALHGLLTSQQYTSAISDLNATLHPARSTNLDAALLATGPLLVPLAVWGVRHKGQVKKRKRLLLRGIDDFNRSYPELFMRWHRRPASCLTIERRVVEVHGPSPVRAEWAGSSGVGSQPPMMVGEYVEAGEEDAFV